jgi:PRTRC genetic system protein B
MTIKPRQTVSLLPPDIEAAVFFMQDQLMFCQREQGDILKPLALKTLRAALSTGGVDSGWLPPAVIRCGESTQGPWAALWTNPASHRLTLVNEQLQKEGQKHLRISAPLPGLVLCGHGRRYALFATEGAEFNPQARALHAPLPNVHPDGMICWGSNHAPTASPGQVPSAWRLFIDSPFNADLSRGKSQACADDVRQQLVALSQRCATDYPLDDLMPHAQATITDCVRSFLRQGGQNDMDL